MPPKTPDESGAGSATDQSQNSASMVSIAQADLDALNGQVESLGSQLAQTTAERDELAGQISSGKSALEAMTAERDALDEKLQDATTAVGTVTAERDEARSALVGASAKISKLEETASLAVVAQPAKLRKVGAFAADDDAEKRRALIEAAIAGEVEVVFSDGETEIRGLDPIKVTGASLWLSRPQGRMLDKPIDLSGPAAGSGAYRIAGFGLFDDEGEQVGWSALPEPIVVGPLTRTQLRQSIIF